MGGGVFSSHEPSDLSIGFIASHRIASHRIGRTEHTWNALSFLFVLLVVMTSRDSIMESVPE